MAVPSQAAKRQEVHARTAANALSLLQLCTDHWRTMCSVAVKNSRAVAAGVSKNRAPASAAASASSGVRTAAPTDSAATVFL
eukprot:COSAG01_NODE_10259_length_2208_cov_1.353722_3_plen_82_part_00